MENEKKLYLELERFLTSPLTTKKDLDDFLWLVEHQECEHRIVGIREFIDSEEYLNARNECWPSIKDDLEELFNGKYDEAVFCEAIGAGKSYKTSVIIAYLIYRILCLKDPQSYFGLAKGSTLYFINMSIRAEQSKKVVFGEIKARIDNSPWFQNHYPPDPAIRSELILAKGVAILPGNSKEDFPLGYNIFGGVMDEAAWYTDITTHDVAEEMFNALHSRIKNRFGDKGLLVMISSPRYIDDFVETKIRESETNKNIFARRKKLWDAKPLSKFSGEWIDYEGYKIPKEFETVAKRNFDKFKRDFMAMPSLVIEPYAKEWSRTEAAINHNLKYPIGPDGKFFAWFRGKPGTSYFGHIDLSLTRDATGIALCHREGNIAIVDLIKRIKPPEGKEVDIAEVRGVIYDLKAAGFSIQMCTFDQFQSASSRQEFNERGINSERLSVDLACYEEFKEELYAGRIQIPNHEEFLMEWRRLELIEGKRIDHPKGSSKDLVDAVVGAIHNCLTTPIFSFTGDDRKIIKTAEEIQREQEQAEYEATGLCRYGFFNR